MDSNDIWRRTEAYCAGGPGTYSKHVSRYPQGVTPQVFERGKDEWVWDAGGRRYIDTVAALGPILLGHAHPRVLGAARAQEQNILCSSMTTPVESRLAERLCHHVPCFEQVRFAMNGADVVQAAVRAARYITGKSVVLCCGYHGMHDWYISTTGNNGGVIDENQLYNYQFPWGGNMNRLAELMADHKDDIAAYVIEVPPQDAASFNAHATFAKDVELFARNAGAMFILDEVVTGVRYFHEQLDGSPVQFGMAAKIGLHPDFITMSKALGNGYPISVIGGAREHMEVFDPGKHPKGPFMSSTFAAWPPGLAACEAVLSELEKSAVRDNLHDKGQRMLECFETIMLEYDFPCDVTGDYARMVLRWRDDERAVAAAYQEAYRAQMMLRQVFTGVPFFPMACWSDDTVDTIAKAAQDTAETMATARDMGVLSDLYPGELSQPVFERYEAGEDAP